MIKPDARILPTEEEFQAWCEHPVTKFIAEAYRISAERQREAWNALFESRLVPTDLTQQRDILRTREDAYRAFLETTFERYVEITGSTPGSRSTNAGQGRAVPSSGQARPQLGKERRGAA